MAKDFWEIYFSSVKKQDWPAAKNALIQIAAREKNNPQVHLKIGDVCQRAGDVGGAINAYHASAAMLRKQGFEQKAAALYKIILRLDPENSDARKATENIFNALDSVRSATVVSQPFHEAEGASYATQHFEPNAGADAEESGPADWSTGEAIPSEMEQTSFETYEEPSGPSSFGPEADDCKEDAAPPVWPSEEDGSPDMPPQFSAAEDEGYVPPPFESGEGTYQDDAAPLVWPSDEVSSSDIRQSSSETGQESFEPASFDTDSASTEGASAFPEWAPEEDSGEAFPPVSSESGEDSFVSSSFGDDSGSSESASSFAGWPSDDASALTDEVPEMPVGGMDQAEQSADDLEWEIPKEPEAGMRVKPDLFVSMSDEDFIGLIGPLILKSYSDNERVVEEGDTGDSIYIVRDGSARVVAHLLGREIELAVLGEGDVFGEVAFLTGRPRTAAVIADGQLSVYELTRSEIDRLIETHPEILARLEEFNVTRVKQTINKVLPRRSA